ncbi:helix-turn-helix domain-containing protein [Streptococcus constellatus]|uniref:helix-turn-helix domain-containing protein n=1 Tax=Streptococcus constellatus TaxID=76860 RepID=UPI001898B704|nr:helix-turn-helix transcriptional regulator [Streptococcus constellatus]
MFTERLKALRKEAGLTQKEIAEQLQIGQNSYSNWEKGIRTPIRPTIEKLAEVLNTSASYLLGESNIKHPENELSNVEILFRKTSKNMTPKQKEIFQKELLEFMEIRRKAFEEDEE